MAYTPTVWATGDVITAEKLNKAENGIEAASAAELPSVTAADAGKVLKVDSSGDWVAANDKIFILTVPYDTSLQKFVPDKTYAETLAAYQAGKIVYAVFPNPDNVDVVYFSAILLADFGSDGILFCSMTMSTASGSGQSTNYGDFSSFRYLPDGTFENFDKPADN